MRPADREDAIRWRGLTVHVDVWIDPEDIAPDWGTDEETAETLATCDGWQILVEARSPGGLWTGRGSLGGVWVTRGTDGDRYLDEEISNVTADALGDLARSIAHDAQGAGVKQAQERQAAALQIQAAMEGV